MQLIARLTLLALLLCAAPASAQLSNIDGTVAAMAAPGGVLVKLTALNLNQANTDNPVTVPFSKYVVRRMSVTNCSSTLAASLATVGLYTGAGATGTTVVTLGLLQALTASTKYVDMTLALTTDVLTASTLYIRNGVTAGSAITCDVYVIGDVLP